MIKAVIISGIAFTIGNITWPYFNDPRVFYIPLAVFMLCCALCIKQIALKESKTVNTFLDYITLLAAGNLIKQIFYNSHTVKQINDYIFGALITAWLIIQLIWDNRKTKGAT